METFSLIRNYFFSSINIESLGLTFGEIALIVILIVLSILVRGIFAKIVVLKVKKLVLKSTNLVDDQIFDSLAPPLKILPITIAFLFIGFFFNNDSQIGNLLNNINQTILTIFLFWMMHQSLIPMSFVFQKLEDIISKALVIWLVRSLKYLIIFLGIVAVLETWGIRIGPIIAGLGLFGVAIALGAQDLFKNLISGILIIVEKRFQLGDVIEVPGRATGTVEHIGFRSTLIRQFDTSTISLPNNVFSDSAVLNFSHRKYRRIKWNIGLTYETSIEQLKKICSEIEKHIKNNNNFIVNDNYQLFVRVDKFNDSSIDILIYTFTKTNDWSEYLSIKEELAYNIKSIVKLNHSSFAFPSHSIYVEQNELQNS